jgi:hypothetical protein
MENRVYCAILLVIGIALVFVGCKKEDDQTANCCSGSGAAPDLYYEIEIDGVPILFEAGENYFESIAVADCCTNAGQELQISILQSILDSTINQGGYKILKNFTNAPSSCADLGTMFSLGTQSFGNSNSGADGIVVYYIDFNGTYWASDLGVAIQSNSSVEISELINNNSSGSEKITTLTVNCTLYDDSGNSLDLTNGIIRSYSLQCSHL